MADESRSHAGTQLRERRRERNAREIQHAAMSLFAERGYAHVTVLDIARNAGVSERTFFRYFASKDHVLVAEAGRRIDSIYRSLAHQEEALDAWKALRNAVLDESAREEAAGRNDVSWAQLTNESPALLAKMIMHGALEGTHDIKVELARRLGVPPTDEVNDLIMRVTIAATQSAYLRWLAVDDDRSLTDLTAQALDLVGVGLAQVSQRYTSSCARALGPRIDAP